MSTWEAIFPSEGRGRERKQKMVFGHNSNLKIGNVTFHVQTEDRGASHALIDTTVYFHGRVLHRRTNNYFDLLPLTEDSQQALKLRVNEQHRAVIDEIRSGALPLPIPAEAGVLQPAHQKEPVGAVQPPAEVEPHKLLLELTNAKSWLSGKHARLQVSVREQNGDPIVGAQIKVEIEGSENGTPHLARTSSQGLAQIEFEMPRITGPEAALVIEGDNRGTKGHLRFSLRAKPRVA